jgi:hypothetical protein
MRPTPGSSVKRQQAPYVRQPQPRTIDWHIRTHDGHGAAASRTTARAFAVGRTGALAATPGAASSTPRRNAGGAMLAPTASPATGSTPSYRGGAEQRRGTSGALSARERGRLAHDRAQAERRADRAEGEQRAAARRAEESELALMQHAAVAEHAHRLAYASARVQAYQVPPLLRSVEPQGWR